MNKVSDSTANRLYRIRILLADDHPLMCQAIRMWLEKQQDMEVVAEARDGKEAVDIAAKLCPDVVIIDISMPKLNGIEATKQIIEKCPGTEVLALTIHTDNETLQEMVKAGASGYLTKNMPGDEIVHAVRSVVGGEHILPPVVYQLDSKTASGNTPSFFHLKTNDLIPRELNILRLVAQGMANKDIALKLGLSLRNVKANLTTIFIKLGVSSRTEAISLCLKSGILKINDLSSNKS